METTPDKHCLWEVTRDYLESALDQIHKHGSTVISVAPYKYSILAENKMEVSYYIIVYYNPPMQGIPGLEGGGDPATIQ